MTALRVHLVRGDATGWAIDEDRKLTQRSLEMLPDLVELVDRPEDAQVIHAVWWEPMVDMPRELFAGRPVVCHMDDATHSHLGKPVFQRALARTTHWLAQNAATHRRMGFVAAAHGASVHFVPYAVDPEPYARGVQPCPLVADALAAVPGSAYVVGSFQRDTIGDKLTAGELAMKVKKGPDMLVEILAGLRARGREVVALLSSPRRHWVRRELERRGVPYVFAGVEEDGDDYAAMIEQIDAAQLGLLYKCCDCYLTTSRYEGGPRGVLEAAAAGVPQLSTPCGLAPDLLHADCLYTSVHEAIEKIERDIDHGSLRRWAGVHRHAVAATHTAEANAPRWRQLYEHLAADLGVRARPVIHVPSVRERPKRVSFWHEFVEPPWGGGNQFMLALKAECERRGIEVTLNGEGEPATAHLIQSVWFNADRVREAARSNNARVVHRVDGPLSVIRRTIDALDLDRRCYAVNRELAVATAVQSWHMLEATYQLGFRPVRPVIVTNACDPAIFYPRHGDDPADPEPWCRRDDPRVRVVATSWSDNPGKGAAVFEWLDRHADHDRYAFTFIGRVAADLPRWTVIDAQPSEPLAELLRGQDIYLAASRDDPCSNALIEALSCGLPALYFDSGGHRELARFGGLPFEHPFAIPALLDRVRAHYRAYQHLIQVPTISEVADVYLRLLFGDASYEP